MKRRGEALDTLVFLIVATLLPMWLLGHLFLAWFPDQSPVSSVVSDTTISAAAGRADLVQASDEQPAVPSDQPPGGSLTAGDENQFDPSAVASASDPSANPSGGWTAEQVAQLQQKYDALDQEHQRLNSQMKSDRQTQGQRTKSLQAELASTKSMLAESKAELAKRSMPVPSAPAADAMRQTESLRASLDQATSQNQQLAVQVENLQTQLGTVAQANKSLSTKNTSLSAQNKSLAEENDSLEMKLIKDSMLAPAPGDVSSVKAELTSRVTQLESQLKQLTRQLSVANQGIVQRDAVLEKIRQQQVAANGPTTARPATQDQPATTPGTSIVVEPGASAEPPIAKPADTLVYRQFTSNVGRIAKLAFVRWENDQVVVRRFEDKGLYIVPITKFSQDDQAFLLQKKEDR